MSIDPELKETLDLMRIEDILEYLLLRKKKVVEEITVEVTKAAEALQDALEEIQTYERSTQGNELLWVVEAKEYVGAMLSTISNWYDRTASEIDKEMPD